MSRSVAHAGFDARGALRAALRSVQAESGLPVAFGAFVENGSTAVLSEFRGTRTNNLHRLEVRTGSGLGGRVIAENRPAAVNDYRTADTITHEYDPWVLSEGLSSIAAAPVMVRDRLTGLIYVATRDRNALGDRSKSAILSAGRRLSMELTVQDEVRRRMRDAEAVATAAPEHVRDIASLEEIRALHAELRAVAQLIPDEGLSQRVSEVSQRLAHVGGGTATASRTVVQLSPREVDVVAQIALGCTNQEAATRLSIKPETAKAYLRGAMRKLGAHSRFEAVVRARALRVIP
ncbi:LuxR C-terminal-related transcriptional regulator [Pseudonocardia sp.]|uniref:LuxR C-terminal-related transcriptional regulator n=1 Tax=Pseudonocardia sp. TaxID=60912 RepID=UPI00261E8C73|nr:LuxR C-terminal-related transcriptional regulator [Pseudonocardia sp.]